MDSWTQSSLAAGKIKGVPTRALPKSRCAQLLFVYEYADMIKVAELTVERFDEPPAHRLVATGGADDSEQLFSVVGVLCANGLPPFEKAP